MLFTQDDIRMICENEFYTPIKPLMQQVCLVSETAHPCPSHGAVFPKKCSKCGGVYNSPEDFLNKTVGIRGHENDICYSIGDQTRIFRYRNCPPPCNSTLVVASEERRDTSETGLKRRELFNKIHESLRKVLPKVSNGACHSIALYLVRTLTFENLSPLEAYLFLKDDVGQGRFGGFAEEPEIVVESVIPQAG